LYTYIGNQQCYTYVTLGSRTAVLYIYDAW